MTLLPSTTSTSKQLEVRANIYALMPRLNGCVRFLSCGRSRCGLWHCGIEIDGREWSYGGHNGTHSGVAAGEPRSAVTGAVFTSSILLGHSSLDAIEVRTTIAEAAVAWPGCEYRPLTRNCNHFATDLAKRLGVDESAVPSWVNQITESCIVARLLPVAERVARIFRIQPVTVVEPPEPADGEAGRPKPPSMYSVLLEAAALQKERGNAMYGVGSFHDALVPYRKTLVYLDNARAMHTGQRATDADALRLAAWSNIAACLLKMGSGRHVEGSSGNVQSGDAPTGDASAGGALSDSQRGWLQECVGLCTIALGQQPGQPKVLYRRAVATKLLGELAAAHADLVAAAAAEPNSKEIRAELGRVKALEQQQRANEKEFARRALGGSGAGVGQPPMQPAIAAAAVAVTRL